MFESSSSQQSLPSFGEIEDDGISLKNSPKLIDVHSAVRISFIIM